MSIGGSTKMNSFDHYQEFTRTTAVYPEAGTGDDIALAYVALGLASEAGEVAGKVKKLIRDGEYDAEALAAELGDVLWYASRLADELGTSLSTVTARNIEKLTSRKERGVIGGNGDNR